MSSRCVSYRFVLGMSWSTYADPLYSWVQTEMGNSSAKAFGLQQAPLGVKESCSGVEALIGEATKESHGGKLWGHDGKQQAW